MFLDSFLLLCNFSCINFSRFCANFGAYIENQEEQQGKRIWRLARAEATLGQCHSMLYQIMTHLGLPHDPAPRQEPATDDDADSLDVLAAAAAASHPSPPQQ